MNPSAFTIIMNLLVGAMFWEMGKCLYSWRRSVKTARSLASNTPEVPDAALLQALAEVDQLYPNTPRIAPPDEDDLPEVASAYESIMNSLIEKSDRLKESQKELRALSPETNRSFWET